MLQLIPGLSTSLIEEIAGVIIILSLQLVKPSYSVFPPEYDLNSLIKEENIEAALLPKLTFLSETFFFF